MFKRFTQRAMGIIDQIPEIPNAKYQIPNFVYILQIIDQIHYFFCFLLFFNINLISQTHPIARQSSLFLFYKIRQIVSLKNKKQQKQQQKTSILRNKVINNIER